MNLFIYTGASRLNAAVVESATDLTAVSRLPDLIVGDSEPVTVKFLSASGAYESWSGGGTYTLSISIGALGGDGIAAYFQTSSFATVTNGWTGRLNLASGSLPSVVAGYLAERPGAQSVPLFVQVRVTDADGNTETYARQAVSISGAVSVPTTANSTPVTYATAADVAADASTASAAAIAAAASASAAAGSASTAAGHVTTAGNSATAAAASAVTAGNSATTASGHATTATTQATNAATSASSASTYKDAAAVSAASATSSAGTATTQAALATTNGAAQVTLAAAQVALATTQATNAGTSASAAAVSAAAALVSEAAALVSKNAAAASAATASAVSGSGNGTFSAAALTGVNSVTASASTALTLTGGSTGASLVLGQGASGAKIVGQSPSSPMTVNIGQTGTAGTSIEMVTSAGIGYIQHFNRTSVAYVPLEIAGEYVQTRTAAGVSTRLTSTGNLLIGTTTDAASLAGGLVVNGSGAGAAASSTVTGALRVTGGVGVSGAGYFGGAVTVSGVHTISSPAPYQLLTATTGTNYAYTEYVNTGNNLRIGLENSSGASIVPGAPAYSAFVASVGARPLVFATNNIVRQTIDSAGAATFAGAVTANGGINVAGGATPAGSANVMAYGNNVLYVGGSGGANVATGNTAGNIFLHGGTANNGGGVQLYGSTNADPSTGRLTVGNTASLTWTATAITGASGVSTVLLNSTPSTSSTSGALQVAGGIYAGAASVFGDTLTVSGASDRTMRVRHTAPALNTIAQVALTQGTTTFGASDNTWQLVSTGESATNSKFSLQYWNGSTYAENLKITSAGAATFAGTISPQQATTAGAPAYVKGAIYFDTTLNKLRVGGATAWETITSV